MRYRNKVFSWVMVSLALAAPLTAIAGQERDVHAHDPYETFNRAMFSVHESLDTALIRPLAKVYDEVPLPLQVGVGNFFGNVGDVWTGANNALQGKPADAGSDFLRVLINSTLGIFGLFDVASEMELEKHDEDLGQTLAVWGYEDSSYLFLPLLGPRTIRDATGVVVEMMADPLGDIEPVRVRNSIRTVRIAHVRSGLFAADRLVDEAALDRYAYIRDAYLQQRRNRIFDGAPPRREEE